MKPSQELVSGCFCGLRGLELQMTIKQALDCSHAGRCDEDIEHLAGRAEIASQLDAIGSDAIRAALNEYGAWDHQELADDAANRRRAVWSAACDIRENHA